MNQPKMGTLTKALLQGGARTRPTGGASLSSAGQGMQGSVDDLLRKANISMADRAKRMVEQAAEIYDDKPE